MVTYRHTVSDFQRGDRPVRCENREFVLQRPLDRVVLKNSEGAHPEARFPQRCQRASAKRGVMRCHVIDSSVSGEPCGVLRRCEPNDWGGDQPDQISQAFCLGIGSDERRQVERGKDGAVQETMRQELGPLDLIVLKAPEVLDYGRTHSLLGHFGSPLSGAASLTIATQSPEKVIHQVFNLTS